MKISIQDAELFYRLMHSLQFYINQKTGLIPDFSGPEAIGKLSQDEKVTARNAVYDNSALITEYVSDNPGRLDAGELDIVRSWANYISGDFFVERFLKNHAIFIAEGGNVFAVKSLYDSFDEMIPKSYLPLSVTTVLLPFKGEIIFDGLLFSRNIYFGGNIKRRLKEDYMRAKENGRIIDTWPPSKKPAIKQQSKGKDWSKEIKQLQKTASPLKGGAGQPTLNSPVFSLIKSSIDLAQQSAVDDADIDELYATLKKIRRNVTKIENTLYRMES